jgi:hypothetical protein
LLSILAVGFFAAPAWADTVAITNPSFEMFNPLSGTCTLCGNYNLGPIPGWTITGGDAGSWQPTSAFLNLPASDGKTVAFSNGGTIYQTLSASLAPNTTYTLSVDVGRRSDAGFLSNYTIELFAGSMLLNALSGSNGVISPGTLENEFFGFTTGAGIPSGDPLTIALLSTGPQTDFDNVRLTAVSTVSAVSEPGSWALLATGLGLALFLFRRR